MSLEGLTEQELHDLIAKLKKHKKYGIVWEEEKTREVFHFDPLNTYPVLEEDKKLSITKDGQRNNYLIEGDNFHALSILNYTHFEKIDLIYIDPPYNTGNSDFRYNDNYVERDDSFKHSKWLSFMKKRLTIARDLLSDKGLIFMSIDENEFAHLKLLSDEIFGEKNYVIDIIWNSRKSVSNDAIVSLNHNHTLVYAKNLDVIRVLTREGKRFKLPIREESYSNPDNDPRGDWQADPFDAPGIRENLTYAITNPNTNEEYWPPKGRCWRTTPQEYDRYLSENRIVFGKTGKSKPQLKRFKSEALEKGMAVKSIWDDVDTTTNGTQQLEQILGEKKFNNPKPINLIQRIIQIGADKDSIILDFMAGSGTTGHAVMEQNKLDSGTRQFVLATNNENEICSDVTYPRLKKVIEGYKSLSGTKVEGYSENLIYLRTSSIDKINNSDEMKMRMTDRCKEIICFKENVFHPEKQTEYYETFTSDTKIIGIYFAFDPSGYEQFKIDLKQSKKESTKAYVFTFDNEFLDDEIFSDSPEIVVEPIPQHILEMLGTTNV